MRGGLSARLAAAAWWGAAVVAEGPLRLMLARRLRSGRELAARLGERRGKEAAPRPAGRLVWIHAASVGETISVLPVLHALARLAPDAGLLLTTGTVTSARVAAERLPAGALHRFVPLDVPRWIGRFLDHWRPDVACFVESEIWPNTLAAAARRGIPLVLLNARMSAASFGWWRRAAGFARLVFGTFDRVWGRSPQDAERLALLGAGVVEAPGDLKFAGPELPADAATLAALKRTCAGGPVWVAASLHPGEEAVVIAAHRLLAARRPALLTILVPRHPARGEAMARACPMPRRALGAPMPPDGLYLADTLGELGLFYRLAACAFVGGSLVPHGGQNPLEAARLGLPVATGPHTVNFVQACAALAAAGALARVDDAAGLAAWAGAMLDDPAAAAAAGAAGRQAASRWADLPERAAAMLLGMIRGPHR